MNSIQFLEISNFLIGVRLQLLFLHFWLAAADFPQGRGARTTVDLAPPHPFSRPRRRAAPVFWPEGVWGGLVIRISIS